MNQPDPSPATVALWLKNISREQLHEQGWIKINKRFHGIARAARPFLQANFPEEQDQEAAFDGFTLALLAVTHFEDIERLNDLFTTVGAAEAAPSTQRTLSSSTTTKPTTLPEPRAGDE